MSGTTHTRELPSGVPVAPGVADITVDPGKVLEVAKVVEEQADALEDKLLTRLGQLRIDAPSADIVSTKATEAWNSLIAEGDESYAAQVRAYVNNLRLLVGQLRTAAKDYKTSDEDKAAHFGDRGVHRT
jgi:hypothetical protein